MVLEDAFFAVFNLIGSVKSTSYIAGFLGLFNFALFELAPP